MWRSPKLEGAQVSANLWSLLQSSVGGVDTKPRVVLTPCASPAEPNPPGTAHGARPGGHFCSTTWQLFLAETLIAIKEEKAHGKDYRQ